MADVYDRKLELMDQAGHTFQFSELQDKLLVLSFIFTSCPEACPMQTQKLKKTQDLLQESVKERSNFLSVSIDPERDTPDKLKKYAETFNADIKHWIFAKIHNKDALKKLSEDLHLAVQKNKIIEHKMVIFLIDIRGEILQYYPGTTFDPQRLAREIQSLLISSDSI